MRNVPTLLRRELGAYFASVLGYVIMMFFLLVMGIFFALVVSYLSQRPTQLTAMKLVFGMFWLPALVVIPAITMRLLAEEKRLGTIEMLMTAPVTQFEVVFAKWLGAVVLYGLMWAVTGVYVLILRQFAGNAQHLDLGPVLAGYVGVLMTGQFLIAVGVLASALTKNQVAAALMAFAVIFLLTLVVYWVGSLFPGGVWGEFFQYLSPFKHMDEFARGIVDLRPVVLYLSGTVLVLFTTTRLVQVRKWR